MTTGEIVKTAGADGGPSMDELMGGDATGSTNPEAGEGWIHPQPGVPLAVHWVATAGNAV
ncbi:MAG: hypothetical protein R3E48_10550 [Burkholderiaceae bacterium]